MPTLLRGLFLFGVRVFGDTLLLIRYSSTLFYSLYIMENQHKKIANLQLHISENCSDLEKEILTAYWEIENNEFVNSVKYIRETFNINQSNLLNLYQYAKISLYLHCEQCNSYEKNSARSQSAFKDHLRKVKRKRHYDFKCDHCIETLKQEELLEEKAKHEALITRLKQAILNKNWNNLNNFEKSVLKNCLQMSFYKLKRHYGKILGKGKFINLINALDQIEQQNLIVLERDYRNYILNFQYLEVLKQSLDDIIITKNLNESSLQQNKETNELKFKLLINSEKHHPDSPLYAGTIVFKERIVIEPNIEYTFGQWERANDQLYLTMIPTSEIEKAPEVKSLFKQPRHIKNHIEDYFKHIKNDF
ncbi:hypothetical protein [Polaribacter ponticola]|uniref:Uncharacterized protein n=1 Tax=Polaribacter ponticola TaxID=2978475 RepID=A0ABT5SD44_9FLAO|nr:hypothetical protein [Polaribacter sp. MSW5]MDD7915480.1 hypothetical protein [Polaribacter sp. MSW5]